MDKDSLETIELELTILFRRITSMTANKKFGYLDRSAYLLLYQIISQGPAGVKALADELHLDISTVSRQTAALEQKGFVFKIPDPSDKRAYSLQITDIGLAEFNKYRQARLARMEEILKYWPDDERAMFGKLLQKYNSSITSTE